MELLSNVVNHVVNASTGLVDGVILTTSTAVNVIIGVVTTLVK